MDTTATMTANGEKKLLPITLLSGFLGAGKTTLLRHILQTQHSKNDNDNGDNKFKCAVIVNDMAQLNIDKSLIEDSALVQSDEAIVSMKNGCICCNLKGDMISQIVDMVKQNVFDYMIIESSGVSEPAQIAKIFKDNPEDCPDQHMHDGDNDGDNHDNHETDGEDMEEEHVHLGEYARLDTCVTVVDCHDFLSHIGEGNRRLINLANKGTTWNTARLMVEQIEYSNVVILNKIDLVLPHQLQTIQQRVKMLNPKAKIYTSSQQKPLADIMTVVNTSLFHPSDFQLDSPDDYFLQRRQEEEEEEEAKRMEVADCCAASEAQGKAPCCGGSNTLESSKSQITLGGTASVVNESPAKRIKAMTRHESRFAVSSFLYTARMPFHPQRFHKEFVTKYFVLAPENPEDDKEREGEESDENKQNDVDMAQREQERQEELEEVLEELQVEAAAKQTIRTEQLGGQLLRSKGFIWLPNMHDMKMVMGQAGSMVTVEDGIPWNVLQPEAWSNDKIDEPIKAKLRKDFRGLYGDRRQELVFIGVDLKPNKIQKVLDDCLLTQDEYDMGIDGWKATFGDSMLDILG